MLVWMRVETKFSPIQITAPANTNDTYVQVAQGDIAVFEVGEIIEIRDVSNSQQLTITSVDAVAYQYHFTGDPLLSGYAVGSNLYHVDLKNCTFPITPESPYVSGPPNYNGICEVCHTETLYWRNDGSGAPHYDGPGERDQCLDCHEHTSEFLGEMPDDAAHNTHTQGLPRGPDPMQCEECHQYGETVVEMADAEACDSCHSPGGAFDGVDDENAVIGVKYNWPDVQPDVPASLDSLIYEADGTALKLGKQDWCAGCHDDGSAVVKGVAAPNVMGDNAIYGFKVSAHDRPSADLTCLGCHNPVRLHIDGEPRTYSALDNNYKTAYRLNARLDVPRLVNDEKQFKLCVQCHNGSGLAPDPLETTSNFRYDRTLVKYLHMVHVGPGFPTFQHWDSDLDGFFDSAMSCPTCHNVHGSPMDVGGTLEPNRVMIRHGELTGLGSAFDFHWYTETYAGGQPTSVREDSRSAWMFVGSESSYENCHALGCHSPVETYNRTPAAAGSAVVIKDVYTCNDNGEPQTVFDPKEPIQFHILYDVQGDPGTQYKVKAFIKAFGKTYEKKALQYPGTDYLIIKDRDQGKRIKVPNTAAGKTKTVVYKLKLKLSGELLDKVVTTSQITVTGP
jgi:hypothetical protein